MSDALAATLIIVGVVPLAAGVVYGRDIAKTAWSYWAMKRSMTRLNKAINELARTCDVLAPCESWIGKEISAPVIAEAEGIAEKAWYTWKPEQVEESSDE